MKNFCRLLFACLLCIQAGVAREISEFRPVLQGVELATATNYVAATGRRQAAFVLRLDLTDPDLQLFAEPPCTNCVAPYETRGRTTSSFVETYKLQGAVNYSFFPECCSAAPLTQMRVFGLLVSEGTVVSPPWTPTDIDTRNGQTYFQALMFDTNKVPAFVPYNWPPLPLEGVHTAIGGCRVLVQDGVPVGTAPEIDPRIAIGISADSRYLILLALDGRQPGYSDGGNDADVCEYLILAGAYNAINVDGGGSTTMVLGDVCTGKATQVNIPIHNGIRRNERVVAGHLGFRAKPVPGFISDIVVEPGSTTAKVTWSTPIPTTSQVRYGLTTSYPLSTPADTTMVTTHTVELSDLIPGTNYFLRLVSSDGIIEQTADACLATTNYAGGMLMNFDQVWKYSVNNLDGVAWKALDYDDSAWPEGPGLLALDEHNLAEPKRTLLPLNNNTTYPYFTYYFRTEFVFTNDPAGATFIFTNYIDDGAAWYLNGTEINRKFLPPNAGNQTLATDYYCRPFGSGDATCPYVFPLTNTLISLLRQGTNVLAAEVHNYNATSPDIAFGTAIYYTLPPPAPPMISGLTAEPVELGATITWSTRQNATTSLEYGTNTALGVFAPSNSAATTNHSIVLGNLQPLTKYYFKAISAVGNTLHTSLGEFTTIPFFSPIVEMTNSWKYTTNNLAGTNWQGPEFDDSAWESGPALLFIENNTDVAPKNTPLPAPNEGGVFPTYYFRTRFQVTNSLQGFALQFSNFVDDGAVFYLNGREIQRLRMAPTPGPVGYEDFATALPPFDDAIYPELFRLGGTQLTNVILGENVLAAEVHQHATNSSDIVFGSAVSLVRALVSETPLRAALGTNGVTIQWDGLGFTLQEATELGDPGAWKDVPGPVKNSPLLISNPQQSRYYRLRN